MKILMWAALSNVHMSRRFPATILLQEVFATVAKILIIICNLNYNLMCVLMTSLLLKQQRNVTQNY